MAQTLIKNQGLDTTTRLSSKVITATRDMTAASGDVAYTGVGFTPTSMQVQIMLNGVAKISTGFVDSSRAIKGVMTYGDSAVLYDTSNYLGFDTASGQRQAFTVKSYDSDGFTLTWTKTGSPTGTITINFLCFR